MKWEGSRQQEAEQAWDKGRVARLWGTSVIFTFPSSLPSRSCLWDFVSLPQVVLRSGEGEVGLMEGTESLSLA